MYQVTHVTFNEWTSCNSIVYTIIKVGPTNFSHIIHSLSCHTEGLVFYFDFCSSLLALDVSWCTALFTICVGACKYICKYVARNKTVENNIVYYMFISWKMELRGNERRIEENLHYWRCTHFLKALWFWFSGWVLMRAFYMWLKWYFLGGLWAVSCVRKWRKKIIKKNAKKDHFALVVKTALPN